MILFFFTISYILGLIFLRSNLWLIIPLSILYFGFLIYRIGIKKSSIALLLFLSGLTLSLYHPNSHESEKITGIVVDARENYYLFKAKFDKFYIYDRENNKECGDILTLEGKVEKLSFASYESQFNFTDYLMNKGVYHQIKVKSEEIKFSNPFRLKAKKDKFLNSFDDDTASLIDSFLFNNKDYKSDVIILADSLNIINLLSMNGVYLFFIMELIETIIQRFLKKKTSELITIIVLLPYAFFSFTKFGVIRVLLMRILSFINKYILKNKKSYLFLLSFECLLFLLFDKNLIYQQSFYLGFLISFVLIFIRKYSKKVNKKFMPLVFTLSVGFLLLPISIQNSGEFHFFTPIFQLLLLPFHELFAISSLISFYTFPFTHYLSAFVRLIRTIYLDLNFIDLSITIHKFYDFTLIIYYLFIALSMYYYESKRNKHFRISAISLLSLLLLSLIPIEPLFINAIYFINVGQGDSIIIQNHFRAVMIDTGGNKNFDMASETLIPFMKKHQIYYLDALITTHDDFDHSGAKESLMDKYKVKNYIKDSNNFPYTVGDIYLENLNIMPNPNEENDKSLVLKLNFMKKTWLFMGDASTEVEKFLIDENIELNCDVLKIGHHGSSTSTSEAFLRVTNPSVAIISVGKGNYYGHPNNEVIERLNKHNINIRRTDIEGTISFVQLAL